MLVKVYCIVLVSADHLLTPIAVTALLAASKTSTFPAIGEGGGGEGGERERRVRGEERENRGKDSEGERQDKCGKL